jgi:hypothetical protein
MSEIRQTESRAITIVLPTRRRTMATIRKDIAIGAAPAGVWQAVRDFSAVHTRVAPGFLTDLKMDKGDRIVTFFNGLVARERLVTVDDEACRLVYAIVEGRPQHYNASVEVLPDGDASRIVWTIDVLPDELGPAVEAMMGEAAKVMTKTLAHA